jgi:hypothetical protein
MGIEMVTRTQSEVKGFYTELYYIDRIQLDDSNDWVDAETPQLFYATIELDKQATLDAMGVWTMVDAGTILKTRDELPFKKEGKILFSLEKDSDGNYLGDTSKIADVEITYDATKNRRNIRSRLPNKIYKLSIG